jgi:hypothetical protein
LSVKNKVKNITAGIKNASDVEMNTRSRFIVSNTPYTKTKKGNKHHIKNKIFNPKRESFDRYKLGLSHRKISGIF